MCVVVCVCVFVHGQVGGWVCECAHAWVCLRVFLWIEVVGCVGSVSGFDD